MLFKKKIVFTEGMNETLCSFDEIPWFSCCGVPYDKPSYYPYLQEKDPKRAEKLLLHTKNYSGTVCLTNLFKEGICALPGFVDSKNEEKTERNAGYLVVSHSGGGMLRQGTRKGIRRTPANRGMRAHRIVKSLDISEDVCHGLCP